MTNADIIFLIENAIHSTEPQQWADLGAGSGTFTKALQTLLPEGSGTIAIDKHQQNSGNTFIKADFETDELPLSSLDGILMANSFHYISDKTKLIRKLEHYFKDTPTFLIVEYDTDRANPWVPYPISFEKLQSLFTNLGYSNITKLATVPSSYGGRIYSALIRL